VADAHAHVPLPSRPLPVVLSSSHRMPQPLPLVAPAI